MQKILILFICLTGILYTFCSPNNEVASEMVLPELSNPHEIISDDSHLIISDGVEGTSIYIYSLKDLSFVSSFGGTGDSIGQFIVSGGHSVGLDTKEDTILISSQWKVSFFKKDGTLIKEIPIKRDTYGYEFLGNHFKGTDDTTENNMMYYTFNLYDEDFKFKKEFAKIAGSNQGDKGLQVLVRKYQCETFENRIYLTGKSDEFKIEVYDENGEEEKVISSDIERIAIEESHKNDVYKMYKEHPLFGKFFETIKKRIVFPEYLPAIYNFTVADDYLYILTYRSKNNNTELYKMNLNGEMIEKYSIPVKWKSSIECFPFTIVKDRFYQLLKNDFDTCELKILEL